MTDRPQLSWHGLPIDGMTREQLIEVVYQLMTPTFGAGPQNIPQDGNQNLQQQLDPGAPGGFSFAGDQRANTPWSSQ